MKRLLSQPDPARLLNHLLTCYAGLCVLAVANSYGFYLRCTFARTTRYYENGFDPKAYGFTTHLHLVEGFVWLLLYLLPVAVMVHALLLIEKRIGYARSLLLLSLQGGYIYAVLFSPVAEWFAD